MDVIKDWLDKNRLIIILKKGKTESMLFGTAKRLCSHNDLKVTMQGNLINIASKYNYLGMHLDPSLNMSNHLHEVLKSYSSNKASCKNEEINVSVCCKSGVQCTYIAYNSILLGTSPQNIGKNGAEI